MTKIGCVYLTTNKVNNKKYIGSLLYNRKNNWKNYLGSGILLKKDIKEYGKHCFSKTILEECETEEELRQREEYFIKQYNAVESDSFYNLKPTAKGGDTFNYTSDKEKTVLLKKANSIGKNNSQYNKKKSEKMT